MKINNRSNWALAGLVMLISVISLSACKQGQNKNKNKKALDTTQLSKIEKLNQDIKQYPNNDSLFHQRSKYFLASGNINKALSDINKAIEMGGKQSKYLITLSDIYFTMPQPQKTEQTLQTILIDNPEHVEALFKLAQFYFYQEEYNKAFGFLNRALENAPNDHRIYFLSGMINKDRDEPEKAERDFHRATESNPQFYEAWIQLGLLAAKEKDSIAVNYYQNALDVRPESEEALYNIGIFYQEQGNIQKAIKTYNQLLDVNPENEKAYYNLGYIHLTITHNYTKAEQYFRQALDVNPSNINTVYNLGLSLEQQRKYEEARKLYRETLEMQDNYKLGIQGMNRLDRKMQ
ncbi:MAG: tetratricopeptide repeat protein [Bacteroidales bacterium]|nr:tetratricopeptide repeat protein [Bacteroidales bacterium]